MLMGRADSLSDLRSSKDQILAEPVSELCDDDGEDCSEQILYSASFHELASNCVRYDTVIWLSISLLLVLAWGVGIIVLLYLPIRRYVLQKDLSSRKLYVTPTKIVYKVSRPSFIPFWGIVKIEKHVSLPRVIDIIIEQGTDAGLTKLFTPKSYTVLFLHKIASLLLPGCLQSTYGIHTFRVESITHGKAAPVDELQVQGVSNPDVLRKVIITEASKISQDASKSSEPNGQSIDVDNMAYMGSLTERSVVLRSPSKSMKMTGSPYYASPERRVHGELLLNKLEEVNRSVKRLELLFEKSKAPPGSS